MIMIYNISSNIIFYQRYSIVIIIIISFWTTISFSYWIFFTCLHNSFLLYCILFQRDFRYYSYILKLIWTIFLPTDLLMTKYTKDYHNIRFEYWNVFFYFLLIFSISFVVVVVVRFSCIIMVDFELNLLSLMLVKLFFCCCCCYPVFIIIVIIVISMKTIENYVFFHLSSFFLYAHTWFISFFSSYPMYQEEIRFHGHEEK